MNPANWSIAEDILPLLGFTTAFVMLLLIPVRPGGTFNNAAKTFFGASILVYMISAWASILSHWNLFPASLNPVVTTIENLWVPFILFGVYALYSHQQITDAVASRHAVKRSSQMLESVVETTPAGIVVLNDVGQITFANGEARRLLDIEDEASAVMGVPEWTVCLGDDGDASKDLRCDFRDLLDPRPLQDVLMTVHWPNGWRRRLSVNTAPYQDENGYVTGAVAAFVDREPWSSLPR
jgi:PAS domain-containing protein